jgi:hypothetical protein
MSAAKKERTTSWAIIFVTIVLKVVKSAVMCLLEKGMFVGSVRSKPMIEKLIRHIAESDPIINRECFHCKEQINRWTFSPLEGDVSVFDAGHAPGCWYVWCCEWVEKLRDCPDCGAQMRTGHEYKDTQYYECLNCGHLDEQNTGDDEDRSYSRQEWWFGD